MAQFLVMEEGERSYWK